MSWINLTKCIPKWTLLSSMLCLSFVPVANAVVQEITAVFRPDPNNPMVNKFENTTGQSPICLSHIPAICKSLNIFSLRTLDLKWLSDRPILAGHESEREGAMFKVPSEFREVPVTEVTTGKVELVKIRMAGVGGGWGVARPPGVGAWGNQYSVWAAAPSPCTSSGYIAAGTNYLTFFWIVPEGAGGCSRVALYDIPWFNVTSLDYAYELIAPNPLDMPTGTYKGFISYHIGKRSADIDFGDVMTPNDSELRLNLTLDVQHTLKVDIPPGGNHVELVPQGGWQTWLNQGRKPSRLFRDQTFNISVSAPFKMQLSCESNLGNTCALKNAVGHEVPVDILVSLPNGLTYASGGPVNRQPLTLDGVGTEQFDASFYVHQKPGTLHFEVQSDAVKEMLDDHAGSKYSGRVSVMWDSEI